MPGFSRNIPYDLPCESEKSKSQEPRCSTIMIRRRSDMKSESETLCKTLFDDFLKGLRPAPSVVWREGPKNKPPDYYVSIDGVEYAVEVTTLMARVPIGPNSKPRATVQASWRKLVREVTETAEQSGFLNGTYLIVFTSAIEGYGRARGRMKTALLDYIRRTQYVHSAPGETVFERPGLQVCQISKTHDASDSVGMEGPRGVKWEVEVAGESCILLEERIREKSGKLGGIQAPKILLLEDCYHRADSTMLKECVPRLPSMRHFHTVLVVGGAAGTVVLHSQNSDWS